VRKTLSGALLAYAITLSPAFSATATPTPEPQPTLNAQELNKRLKDAAEHKAIPTTGFPKIHQHVEFVVETNKKGQVTRVRSGKESPDGMFNAVTYGNALQTFIRTEDGKAIAGTYRLVYDYEPADKQVKRTVELINEGGVDPDALGAVDDMARAQAKTSLEQYQAWKKEQAAKAHASPAPKPTTHP
jgi:hypothetical protein